MNINRSFKCMGLIIIYFLGAICFAFAGAICGIVVCYTINFAAFHIGLSKPFLPPEINKIIIVVVGCYVIYHGFVFLILKTRKEWILKRGYKKRII